jgi:methylated-DNA-[protein]-cysteine S-methyltransferase
MKSKNPNSFNERCYALLRQVPRGKVTTYRGLAHALGTKAYRAVGNAMNKNPYFPEVPCNRVINSDGRLGGFASGLKEKIKLLKQEGIEIVDNKIDLNKYLYKF